MIPIMDIAAPLNREEYRGKKAKCKGQNYSYCLADAPDVTNVARKPVPASASVSASDVANCSECSETRARARVRCCECSEKPVNVSVPARGGEGKFVFRFFRCTRAFATSDADTDADAGTFSLHSGIRCIRYIGRGHGFLATIGHLWGQPQAILRLLKISFHLRLF